MPFLGDLLGHLLGEITIARSQADIESVRIAELYANHPLLKHFSVPRFRLPDVSIELPVALTEMEETPPGTEPRGKLGDISKVEGPLSETLSSIIKRQGIELSDSETKSMESAFKETIPSVIKDATRIKDVPTNLTQIAGKLVEEVQGTLKEKKIELKSDDLRSLKIGFRQNLLSAMEEPPRLRVLVTTKELQEYKNTDQIIRLRLTISEESVEWTTIDIEGETTERLIPE